MDWSRIVQDDDAYGPMTLGDVMDFLKNVPGDVKIPVDEATTYRGDYSDLAIHGAGTTVADFVKFMKKKVVNKVLVGYKGGDFTMHRNVGVWVAPHGDTGPALARLEWSAGDEWVTLVVTDNHRYAW